MIRHIVLVRFRKDLTAGEMEAIVGGLRGLVGRIEGLKSFRFGPNARFEDLDRGFAHGICMDFTDADSIRRYHADAEHRALGTRLVAAAEGGLDGLLVFDLESPD